jgi:hypothetical protein
MRTPGFTAETSLRATSEFYSLAAVETSGSGSKIVPQLCRSFGPCRVCVDVRIFPPRACLRFSCFGFSRSFCVP